MSTSFLGRMHCLASTLPLIAAMGCGGGGGGGSFDGKNAPYGEWTPTTKTMSTLQFSLGGLLTSPDIPQVTAVIGKKTIGDKTYDRLATLNVGDSTQGGEYWINVNPDHTVDFAGVDLHSTLAATVLPPGNLVFDAAVKIALDVPIGQAQPLTITGTYTPTSGAASPVQATGQYTLVEKDAMAQTNAGPVSGCSHFTGSASSSSEIVPAIVRGVSVAGELWYHPSFGVVAFKTPALGLDTRMAGTEDCGSPDTSGHVAIRKVGVLDASHGSFELSSYLCSGTFDADKMTHAKMLLELRWLDEATAKGTTQPTVSYTFQTVMGVFPSMLTQSPVSILHPEENSKGFVYWIAFVDQAAKNEAGSNGISYGVKVTAGTTAPVRASARIYYKKYP